MSFTVNKLKVFLFFNGMRSMLFFVYAVAYFSLFTTQLSAATQCDQRKLWTCEDQQVCFNATIGTATGIKWYTKSTFGRKFYEEAKRRNLSCGVETYAQKCKATKADVIEIQSVLSASSLYKGKIDGIIGPKTLAAIKMAKLKLRAAATDSECITKLQLENLKRLGAGNSDSVKQKNELCGKSNPSKCSSAFVCTGATISKGGTKVWDDQTATGRTWISEAKRRKIDCGVSQILTSFDSETCGKSNPSKCSSAFVCTGATISKGGTKIWDEQTATGRAWVSEAKRRKIDCGVSKTVTNIVKMTCSKFNPSECNSDIVCVGATITNGESKLWDEKSPTGRIWVTEAKRRGLSCGVKDKEVVASKVPTCDDDPALCSVVQLCQKASSFVNGSKAWSAQSSSANYVKLAQQNGLTCGVKSKQIAGPKTKTCDDDPTVCSVVQLCQKASSFVNGSKEWRSQSSSTSYVKLAKETGVTCGVQEKPALVAKAANCSTDPSKCSVIELCTQATGVNASGEKFWRMDASLQAYVDTAKLAGVSCGVPVRIVETTLAESCDTNPSKCSLTELCQRAISFETGKLGWTTSVTGASYVQFAKNSGMTCGVQEDIIAVAPAQKQIEPAKAKAVQKYTNRKALVIGNANYADQAPLKNPINDAKAVAAKLEQVGFEVTYKEDLKYRDFGRTLVDFKQKLQDTDMSLIYYAGHGIEIDKQNYLIPVDAELRSPDDARFETVMLDEAISASVNTGKLSMVLIDACRNNPFIARMDGKKRSIGRGLSIVEVGSGTVNQIISFAASSGEVAEDGSGQNSPYASALLDLLDRPNLEVGKMFRVLGDVVSRKTDGKQVPVTRNRLSGEDIFLVIE